MHHFDLHYDIVRMRHDELVQRATSLPGRGKEPRRGWFGRRRRKAGPPAPSSVGERRRLVAVPPPGHAAAEHDTQVA